MIKTKLCKAEQLFLLINALLLIFFAAFVYLKTRGLADEGWLCYPFVAAFVALGFVLIFILNNGFRRWDSIGRSDAISDSPAPTRISKNWYITIIILYIAILFAYDFSVAEAWIDAKGDVETAQLLRTQGLSEFIKQYHNQTAHEILDSEEGRKGIQNYAKLLPFYPLQQRLEELDKAWGGNLRIATSPGDSLVSAKSEFGSPLVSAKSEFGSPLVSLPNGADKALANNRTQHHPPLFFTILAAWLGISGSLLSLKIFAKVMLLLYLLAIWFLLRNHFRDKQLSLISLLAIALMPALLFASQAPRNDLLLGIISSLIALLLMHVAQRERVSLWLHPLLGVLCFMAVFSKFTALLIALPVLAIYLYRYRLRVFTYLAIVALPVLLLPLIMYLAFGYDILLNIITGRVVQDLWLAENIDAGRFIVQRLLFGQFRVGLPIILLALFILPQLLKRKEYRPHLILFAFYVSIFLLLWGSSVDRHQIGFLPFAIPLISLACSQYRRLLKPILILLLLYNILFIFYAVVDNGHDREHVLPVSKGLFHADWRGLSVKG